MKRVPVMINGDVMGEATIDEVTSKVTMTLAFTHDLINTVFCHSDDVNHDPELQVRFLIRNKKNA